MQRKKQDIIVGVIFTIEKAGRRMRWKVIEHPYFDGLTLVRDYCDYMGLCDPDIVKKTMHISVDQRH